jgi:adenine-specific DNA-methyltransferase
MTSEKKSEPERLDLRSLAPSEERQAEIARLFPEARTEGGKIDFEQLKRALGQTVDAGKERYGLLWPGKAECFKTIQAPSIATLRPAPHESVNFDATENLIIEGDNLEVLKLLQKSYLGKVKMIYIDPPYNTGSDFIYPDNFAESLQTYLEYTGQADAAGRKFGTNTEADGRFHSKWLSMMYPRIYLARNLLRQDGSIFISIDDTEVDNLRMLCNEIFGPENFCAQISVINNLKGRNSKKNIATCHEFLLIYSKSDATKLGGLPLTPQQRAQFKYQDERKEFYALRDLRKRGGPDRREDRPNMAFSIFFNPTNKRCSLERTSKQDIEVVPTRGDDSPGRWRWGKKRVSEALHLLQPRQASKGGRWDVDVRFYLKPDVSPLSDGTDDDEVDEDDTEGQDDPLERSAKPKSFWTGPELSSDAGKRSFKALLPDCNYDYPKAVDFIKRCINIGLNEDEIILDFFAGSGTTAQAVLELNADDNGGRRFVLVQLPETTGNPKYPNEAEIVKERTRRVIKQLNDENNSKLDLKGGSQKQDRGFRVFRLAESNFQTWDADSARDSRALVRQLELHVDHLRKGRNAPDFLYEILLKSGFPLTALVERLTLAGKTIFGVAGGALLICLDRDLTLELVRVMADRKPERVVCLDEGFAGNDQLKTNAVQTFKIKNIVFRTV